jgi:hypothetical protein
MNTLGVFSQPSYLTIGDEYTKKSDEKGRHKGKQFQTNPTKKGQVGPNVTFDTFKPLFEGEKYTDPGVQERKYQQEQKKRQLVAQPFKPSSPPKKSTTLGGLYGYIGKLPEHAVEYDVVKKGEHRRGKIVHEKRNIMTSPTKKGTYGFPGTTIGKEYEYKPETYDNEKELSQKEREEQKKKMQAKPFKTPGFVREYFDVNVHVGTSKIYSTDDKVLPPKSEPTVVQKQKVTPFRPSSPPKKGYNSTINPFPTYQEDPYDKVSLKKDPNRKSAPVFRPVSCGKSKPTRSIIFGTGLSSTL